MAHVEPHHAHGNPGVEPEGLSAGMVIKVTLATVFIMAIVIVAGFQIAQRAFRESKFTTTEMSGYPLLRTTTEQGRQAISEYGPVTGAEGRYRIPIDRAIDLMVNEAAAARAVGSALPAVR
jgi:hypothetical protein